MRILGLIPDLVLTLLFGSGLGILLILEPLRMLGRCAILKKCGHTRSWQGAIPLYGEYLLAKCVAREVEGRSIVICTFVIRLMDIILVLLQMAEQIKLMGMYFYADSIANLITMLAIPLIMVTTVYRGRVYIGLCDLFGKKHRWVLLMLPLDWLLMIYWGTSKRFQAQWQLGEVEEEVSGYFSNSKAVVMNEGLTINLEERSAREFLKKKKVLLRDVHMYIKPGRMVLLLGGSGAGKTTLLNAVNGYEKAKAEIHLNGSNVYSEYKRMQYDIGFVPQLDLMRGSDTVHSTLLDAARLRLPSEMYGKKRRERVDEVMGIFGLKPVKDNMVSKLSGGQRKRLSIAMEFLSNPSLFILDEPDSGLDGVMARELMEQLRRIADSGKIVIVITHTPDRVIDLFDDVIVLAKDKARTGRLAYFGPIEEARTFFGKDSMEQIVRSINRKEEGGEGRADEFVNKYVEVMQRG